MNASCEFLQSSLEVSGLFFGNGLVCKCCEALELDAAAVATASHSDFQERFFSSSPPTVLPLNLDNLGNL